MKKLLLATTFGLIAATASFAGQQYNPEVSGVRDCEMVKVMSELNPGTVLYTYRADPTCGNVRTSRSVYIGIEVEKDKDGNITKTKITRTVGDEDNGG